MENKNIQNLSMFQETFEQDKISSEDLRGLAWLFFEDSSLTNEILEKSFVAS